MQRSVQQQHGVRKYHRDVYFPPQLDTLCRAVLREYASSYQLTKHARDRLFEKGVDLPRTLPIGRCDIIEATMSGRFLNKILVRFPHDATDDVVFGLSVEGWVTTVYWNQRDDEHRTLRVSQYVRVA